jgi:hypothetical protein
MSAARFRVPRARQGPTFNQARAQMRGGAVLRLSYTKGRPTWTLGDLKVAAETVAVLLACSEIVPAEDTLFPGEEPPQTWILRQ